MAVTVLEVLDERLPQWRIAQPRVALRWIVSTSTHGCAELILATGHEQALEATTLDGLDPAQLLEVFGGFDPGVGGEQRPVRPPQG